MSTRGCQVTTGAINRWKARFGMTEAEVREAQELRAKVRDLSMEECCRLIVREADRKTV